MSNYKLSYLPELDGLRGLAIIFVILFHANFSFFSGGFIGVEIFFVLSGFLITSLLIQEFDSTGTIKLSYFYMRRVLRLGPALLLLLIAFCILSFLLLSEEKANRNFIDVLISLFYLSNWARAFDFYPPDFLGHTWSLSIEEQFYILWPIILLILLRANKKNRLPIICFAVMVALVSWLLRIYFVMSDVPLERVYNGLDTRADSLMVGCALGVLIPSRLISEKIKDALSGWLEYIAPFSIALLLFLSFISNWQDNRIHYLGFFVVELLVAILILDIIINENSMARKILAMRWLVWVGSISYGLYLWHYPIFKTMFALGFNGLMVVLLGTFVTFIIAICSYYFLERPMLKFKKPFNHIMSNNSH
jgi:peptidoglycan/LPS O-acetylase OafA/YrhL